MLRGRKRSPKRRPKKRILILLAAAGLIALLLLDHLYYRERIYPGVYLQNISLGGADPAAAEKAIARAALTFARPGGAPLTISRNWAIPIRERSWSRPTATRQKRASIRRALAICSPPPFISLSPGMKNLQQASFWLENALTAKQYAHAAGEWALAEIIAEETGFKLSCPELVQRIHESLPSTTALCHGTLKHPRGNHRPVIA